MATGGFGVNRDTFAPGGDARVFFAPLSPWGPGEGPPLRWSTLFGEATRIWSDNP